MKPRQIATCTVALSADKDIVFNHIDKREGLLIQTQKTADRLKLENIEIFETRDNILVTEKGYYIHLFSEDLELKQ